MAGVALAAALAGGYEVRVVTGPSAPAACHGPTLPSGDAISVDRAGNADTPPDVGGATEFVCTDGMWVRVAGYGNAARPMWDGTGTYAGGTQALCPASMRGLYRQAGTQGHWVMVRCDQDGPVYVWDAVQR